MSRCSIPKVENCGRRHIVTAHIQLNVTASDWAAYQEEAMPGTARRSPTGLDESQVFRLFKCALKDDDRLVDAVVERLYRRMKEFDLERADDTVELIVDRNSGAGSRFGAFLDDLWPDRRPQFAPSSPGPRL